MRLEVEKDGAILLREGTRLLEKTLYLNKGPMNLYGVLKWMGVNERDLTLFNNNAFKGNILGTTIFVNNSIRPYYINLITNPITENLINIEIKSIVRLKK